YRDACLTAGMDDMLSKPYTLEECAQVVRRFGVRGAIAASTRAPSDPLASGDAAAVATLRRPRSDERVDLYSKLGELFQAGPAPRRPSRSSPTMRISAACCSRKPPAPAA